MTDKPPSWFTENMRKLAAHRDECDQCRRAGLGRFAGATPEEINDRRCPEGCQLGELVGREIEELERRGEMDDA